VYTKAGTYKIAADVATFAVMGHGQDAWNSYYDATDFQTITVRDRPVAGGPAPNQPPTASFTTDATPGYAERPVSFDATASSDPDGQIVSYEWDFGDGSPTKTTTTPTVSHTYVPDPPQDTVYSATLRVTDDKGATGDTKRSVPVNEFLPPDSGLAGIAAARRGTPFQATAGGQVLNAGTTIYSGGTVLHTGLYARGRMTLAKLAKPLDHKRTARWAARFTQKQHGNEDAAKFAGEGFMLLDLGHHDRLCLSGRVSGSIDAQTTGALSVAGGSGIAGHLRGSATFAIPPGSGTARGLLTLARTRKARKLPPACVSLVRKLR
jgi:hypothetical protein